MVDQLAHLLRASLRSGEADEVTLEEEWASGMPVSPACRGRFGERLAVEAPGVEEIVIESAGPWTR